MVELELFDSGLYGRAVQGSVVVLRLLVEAIEGDVHFLLIFVIPAIEDCKLQFFHIPQEKD